MCDCEWRDITTAPKDGTRLLLYGCEYRRHWFGTGYYFKGVPGDGEGWIAHSFYTAPHNDSSGSFTPSHWMPMLPLPAPPLSETIPSSLSAEQATRLRGMIRGRTACGFDQSSQAYQKTMPVCCGDCQWNWLIRRVLKLESETIPSSEKEERS